MTIHVDELRTDVSVEPATAAAPASPGADGSHRWRRVDELRALRDRLAREAERTSADGYSD